MPDRGAGFRAAHLPSSPPAAMARGGALFARVRVSPNAALEIRAARVYTDKHNRRGRKPVTGRTRTGCSGAFAAVCQGGVRFRVIGKRIHKAHCHKNHKKELYNTMGNTEKIKSAYSANGGIFKLLPVFVPRQFSAPGRRLRLHPDDYFALGTPRGAIKERWFSSVIRCNNGPLAAEDEGYSYINMGGSEREITLKEAVEVLGAALIGQDMQDTYGTWPMYSKFFDYAVPLFHHLHLGFEDAARVRCLGKPEAYYYPPQYNNYAGSNPATYFGFDPDCTREQVRERLQQYLTGDNRITELSRAYRIELGTGWYTPPGVVHAPGSYLTYEPQWNSDVNSVYENVASGEVYPHDFLAENLPEEERQDVDKAMALMDWEKNVDPHYKKSYFRPPLPAAREEGVYEEKWVVYGNPYVGAKELTVWPGQSVTLRDSGAYGCILTQGHGTIGNYACEAAGMLRFGQESADEFFVGAEAADRGVKIVNLSVEPLVMLKHFGPNHPEMP